MPNRLSAATSPYLLQHAHNPVEWWPWGPEALDAARQQDKPILLSVGYAACHWCHVMAHESFENAATASMMNERFINVKVDREERPDIDQLYQHALAVLGQQGGWPLTMFLTPDGEPFWGGTYFPPEQRYGRPGFPQVLEAMARIWQEERDKVHENRSALQDALQRLSRPGPSAAVPSDLPARVGHQLVQAFDTIHGGLAGAPKFPQAPILDFLWRYALLTGDVAARHAVIHTLARICQGGIYDHLGGGFARYAVDAMWLVPHFEKMLYDNGQLLRLLADNWADTHDPLFATRAVETVGWLEREMVVDGAYASSLDADSEGEEGRFYVWQADEVDRKLGPDSPAFRLAYGITDRGNWEGKTVLNRLHEPGLRDPDTEAALRASADRLLAVRERRPRPMRDDKVLADWNGLTIGALVRAAAVFERDDWLDLAERAFASVCRNMERPEGRLAHSWRAGQRLDLAFLDDYVQLMAAALDLHAATAGASYLERCLGWLDTIEADHADPDEGGYFLAAVSASDVIMRTKSALDGPTPTGTGTLAQVLLRLHQLTGDPDHRARAEALLEVFGGDIARNPIGHPSLLIARMMLEHPVQVVVFGEPANPAYRRLAHVASTAAYPDVTVVPVAAGRELPASHPASGKSAVGGRPTAYVCIGPTCQLPLTDPDDLRAALTPAAIREGIPAT